MLWFDLYAIYAVHLFKHIHTLHAAFQIWIEQTNHMAGCVWRECSQFKNENPRRTRGKQHNQVNSNNGTKIKRICRIFRFQLFAILFRGSFKLFYMHTTFLIFEFELELNWTISNSNADYICSMWCSWACISVGVIVSLVWRNLKYFVKFAHFSVTNFIFLFVFIAAILFVLNWFHWK